MKSMSSWISWKISINIYCNWVKSGGSKLSVGVIIDFQDDFKEAFFCHQHAGILCGVKRYSLSFLSDHWQHLFTCDVHRRHMCVICSCRTQLCFPFFIHSLFSLTVRFVSVASLRFCRLCVLYFGCWASDSPEAFRTNDVPTAGSRRPIIPSGFLGLVSDWKV